ncbi:hypothetical protein ACOCJ5_03235 [Knoellia sp. CPCC 206450]|jgi:hypothetical protein|uniref:hypothetical protein n=1 Tax=Knoellia tibetensis TaxID=3404798 RepID=UPI003B43611B
MTPDQRREAITQANNVCEDIAVMGMELALKNFLISFTMGAADPKIAAMAPGMFTASVESFCPERSSELASTLGQLGY